MFSEVKEIRETRKKYNWQMYQSGIRTFREIEEVEAQPSSVTANKILKLT